MGRELSKKLQKESSHYDKDCESDKFGDTEIFATCNLEDSETEMFIKILMRAFHSMNNFKEDNNLKIIF